MLQGNNFLTTKDDFAVVESQFLGTVFGNEILSTDMVNFLVRSRRGQITEPTEIYYLNRYQESLNALKNDMQDITWYQGLFEFPDEMHRDRIEEWKTNNPEKAKFMNHYYKLCRTTKRAYTCPPTITYNQFRNYLDKGMGSVLLSFIPSRRREQKQKSLAQRLVDMGLDTSIQALPSQQNPGPKSLDVFSDHIGYHIGSIWIQLPYAKP